MIELKVGNLHLGIIDTETFDMYQQAYAALIESTRMWGEELTKNLAVKLAIADAWKESSKHSIGWIEALDFLEHKLGIRK